MFLLKLGGRKVNQVIPKWITLKMFNNSVSVLMTGQDWRLSTFWGFRDEIEMGIYWTEVLKNVKMVATVMWPKSHLMFTLHIKEGVGLWSHDNSYHLAVFDAVSHARAGSIFEPEGHRDYGLGVPLGNSMSSKSHGTQLHIFIHFFARILFCPFCRSPRCHT